MKRRFIAAMVSGLLLSVATPALAQDEGSGWYAGVSAGRMNADFRPYYTYYLGGTPDQFENEAHGLQVEFLVGKRRQLSKRWSMSLQGSASVNSFEWSLSIPEEPAELEYSLPYRVALSVIPEVHFGRVSVFADLGGGVGRVREMKTTPNAQVSRYDYDEIRPTLNLGAGARVKASNGFDVFAHAGYARHFGVEYDSIRLMTGLLTVVSKVEHVTDSPRATGFTIGVIKRF